MAAILKGQKVSQTRKKQKILARSRFVEEMTPAQIEAQRERSIVRVDGVLKIMCCSEAIDPHPGEIPMWSYYANCHRGVRVHFRRSFYTQQGVLEPQVIDYDDTPVKFGFHEISAEGMRPFIDKVLKTKSVAWRHEEEVRLLIANSALRQAADSKGTMRWWLPVKPEHVSRIDLGVKFDNAALIEELLRTHPALPIFRASKNPDKYLCDYRPII